MKQLTLESKEFKRVMHNLHLENLSISRDNQRKIIEIVNAKTKITPTLIKDLMK